MSEADALPVPAGDAAPAPAESSAPVAFDAVAYDAALSLAHSASPEDRARYRTPEHQALLMRMAEAKVQSETAHTGIVEPIVESLHQAGTLTAVASSFERLPSAFGDAVRAGLSQPVSGATPQERLAARVGAIGAALPSDEAVEQMFSWFDSLDVESRNRILQELAR